RERGDDIVPLAEALAVRIAANYGLKPPAIPAIGQKRLRAHRWPGNVRELAHEIERSLVFDEDHLAFSSLANAHESSGVTATWVAPDFQLPESGFSLEAAIDALIRRALNQCDGNVSGAA